MPKPSNSPSKRVTVRQSAERADYDRDSIYAVIDDAIVATIAIADDDGPIVIPMVIGRIDDAIYLHGSRTSRIMRYLAAGHPVSVCVHHLDGLVVARSTMHCSANYRSAVIHGRCELVDETEKVDLLDALSESIFPGSSHDFRDHLPKELKATALVRLSLAEAAAKIRCGGPNDDEEDLELPYWAGVIPIRRVFDAPIDADDLPSGINAPDYARHYRRPG
ncbi:pyridoxamine 5'-phosphate oxidase family protein [Gammaproteobacteria bacterium]|nr:pyridoxamine 5'-phosphate oxidase family protein [Gammaproteobacteria bacterium]